MGIPLILWEYWPRELHLQASFAFRIKMGVTGRNFYREMLSCITSLFWSMMKLVSKKLTPHQKDVAKLALIQLNFIFFSGTNFVADFSGLWPVWSARSIPVVLIGWGEYSSEDSTWYTPLWMMKIIAWSIRWSCNLGNTLNSLEIARCSFEGVLLILDEASIENIAKTKKIFAGSVILFVQNTIFETQPWRKKNPVFN